MKKELTLEEVKQVQLNMLLYFDEWCNKHGLHYSLAGGTLLGAIRHKGFIPWDDDIDVFMERKQYEKFLEEWDGPYELITNKQHGWVTGHARLTDNNTILKWEKWQYLSHGLWIAILPIDNFPDNNSEWDKFRKKLDFAMALGRIKNIKWINSINPLRNFFRLMLKMLLIPVPYPYVSRMINNTLQSYNNRKTSRKANISTYTVSKNHWPQVFDASCFDSYIRVYFENHSVESMVYPEKYLESTYGDWRKLPPEEERVGAHYYTAYWID